MGDDDIENKHRIRIETILMEINNMLLRADRKENILFVGETGAGKSSLKNSITHALTERWEPQAQVGLGANVPITERVIWYKNCGVEEEDNNVSRCLLPDLIDMAGYKGQDLKKWRQILIAIVEGRLPHISNLSELSRKLENSPRFLEVLEVDESKRITKIVFVASVTETINEELIELVHDIAHGSNRFLHVYGALTNCDCVERRGKKSVTQTEYELRKDAFIRYLRIKNVENDYFSELTNYSSVLKPGNLQVQIVFLEFIKKLLVKKIDPYFRNPLLLSDEQKLRLFFLEYGFRATIGLAIVVAIVIIMQLLLKDPVAVSRK